MLALAPDGGQPSHRAVISRSTPTGLLRFINSMASTARCLGVPNGTRAPSTLISNGPRRPNSRRLSAMVAYQPFRILRGVTTYSVITCHCDTNLAGFGIEARLRNVELSPEVCGRRGGLDQPEPVP